MRRIVLSLAVLGAASLAACSGGGSVLNSSGANTPDNVIVTVAGSNVARVLPGASLPISAVAVSGSQNGVLSNNRFTWTATLVTSGAYTSNTTGQTKPCAQIMQTPAGGTAAPFTADFSIYITIDPTNEANVLFAPPPIVPAPAGSTLVVNYPYCVVVSASAVGSSAVGSITVAVVNPQNPLQ